MILGLSKGCWGAPFTILIFFTFPSPLCLILLKIAVFSLSYPAFIHDLN